MDLKTTLKSDKMKRLSIWGKNNPTKAKIIIGISHTFIVLNAICLGFLLFVSDFGTFKWISIIFANLFFIAYLFYPEKDIEAKQFQVSYKRRKIHDFFLVISYAIVIVFGINNFLLQENEDYRPKERVTAKFIVNKSKSENQASYQRKPITKVRAGIQKIKKQIRYEFRELKYELRKQNDRTGLIIYKILLTMLIVGATLALGMLVAALACNLSCSGNEGLAYVVLVLGWTSLIWLQIILIKKVVKMKGQKKNVNNPPADD
jgi:hypothetical protein